MWTALAAGSWQAVVASTLQHVARDDAGGQSLQTWPAQTIFAYALAGGAAPVTICKFEFAVKFPALATPAFSR